MWFRGLSVSAILLQTGRPIYHEHAAVHSGHNGGEDRIGASVRCHTEQKHQAEEFSQGCDVPALCAVGTGSRHGV